MDPVTTQPPPEEGWRQASISPSLPESFRSVHVPAADGARWLFFRKLWAFAGPGFLVAVGYMDPGNWATDLSGGAKYAYALLSVILISNFMAILLHHLTAKLGIVTGRDLAQACRDHYSKKTVVVLWLLCEAAICACDLAEVVGSAVGLKLLFGIPLIWGVCITAADVLIILIMQKHGFRLIELLVVLLIATIGMCFLLEIIWSKPVLSEVMVGFIPTTDLLHNSEMLMIGIGILGATVMPHNLYLHSSIVQTRRYEQNDAGRAEAIKYATLDSSIALMFALFVNAAILIVAAATFYTTGHHDVADIEEAHHLLAPLLGVGLAGAAFAIALLASGQNSTLTGTLAGQITMEGFVNIRLRPWLRRLITRLIAIIPAVICVGFWGDEGTVDLLVISQVILSMQLPFAVIPLVQFVSDKQKMGKFVIPIWIQVLSWVTAGTIVYLNIKLLLDMLFDNVINPWRWQ
ncbi:MAG TPA: Nramp family divalent metal transporter [Planctomycetota bacterium]|nr:Nramp family divalent metal transporter [Planctomycetota bacterium]